MADNDKILTAREIYDTDYLVQVGDHPGDLKEIPKTVGIKGVSVRKAVNKIPKATLIIDDGDAAKQDFKVSGSGLFLPGRHIEIDMGHRSKKLKPVFKGIIVGLKNKISPQCSELIVFCKDPAVKMTLGRMKREFNGKTDHQIAEEIVATNGLTLSDIEGPDYAYENVLQNKKSDWDFLLERFDRLGMICNVENGKLSFKKPDLKKDSVVELTHGLTIIDYHAEINTGDQPEEVKMSSWDYDKQELVETQGSMSEHADKETGNLPREKLSKVLEKNNALTSSAPWSDEQQQQWTDALLDKYVLGKVRGSVKFNGFPDISPGKYLRLKGVGKHFEGTHFVESVRQDFEEGLWTTEVDIGQSPKSYAQHINPHSLNNHLGILPMVEGLYNAVVTDLEDPEEKDRVRVKFPTINNDGEGVWARIASLDAGENRGWYFRPEIGDEVIVGFVENNIDYPVILGMLNSPAKPAPFKADNDNNEKGYISREGIKFKFDEAEKSVIMETPAGKKVVMNEKDNLTQLVDENQNEVTMDSNGITIQSNTDINFKANASIKLEAQSISVKGTSVSVNGDGMTEIKGGLVKIN